ncbi:MAG TPA: nitrate reductase molybdenum cofactor assembly chaperone [bacterium]
MADRVELYDQLAALLAYPDGRYREKLERCQKSLEARQPEAAEFLSQFATAVETLSAIEMEELFVGTFDFNATCALEVGWHLYGEDYQRGAFLVEMRAELRRLAVPESSELPDHLTHVLMVLGRLEPDEANDLAVNYFIPALTKILDGFKEKGNPYEYLLKAISSTLEKNHQGSSARVEHE